MFDINTLTKKQFASYFEGSFSRETLLYWLTDEIEKGLQIATEYGFRSFICPNDFIPEAKKRLAGTSVKVLGTFSFPRGMLPTKFKIQQLEYVMDLGADTCDGCLNMNHIKNHEYELVKRDANEIVAFAKKKNPRIEIKFIAEFGHMTDEEILAVARIVYESGADVYKMGTGWRHGTGTSPRKIRLVKSNFPDLKIKGYGGELSFASIIENLQAGTDIIGSSSANKLLEEWDAYFRLKDQGFYK
jgi:deoxyribose-phosphate aldolase